MWDRRACHLCLKSDETLEVGGVGSERGDGEARMWYYSNRHTHIMMWQLEEGS